MSNLLAALTPMPTNSVRTGLLLPETSQAEGEELAALFAGVLATMMPAQIVADELPEQALPEQALPELMQRDEALPERPLQSRVVPTEADDLPEVNENSLAVFAQVPSLAIRPTSTPAGESASKSNDTATVVMGQPQNKSETLKAQEPVPLVPSTEADVVDEVILTQLPKKPLIQAIAATVVLNDTQQQLVVSQAGVTVKSAEPTVMPALIKTVSNDAQDFKDVANTPLNTTDLKAAEAAFAGLNNKIVMATSVPTTTATATVVSVPVSIHNERAFSEAFGLQLVKLAAQGITQATVRINPQELGPIDVRIVMNGQQTAQIDFQARQAQTADLLETMMPRLVLAMEAQGIRLDEARVSTMSATDAQSFAQQFGRQGQEAQADTQARGQGRATVSAEAQSDDVVPDKPQPRPDSPRGRIDYYA